MLGVVLLSFRGALVCTLILVIANLIVLKKREEKWKEVFSLLYDFKWYIALSFLLEFCWMMGFLYVSCKSQTFITVVIWIWPALLINFCIIVFFVENSGKEDYITMGIMTVISGILCLSINFAPVQNMIYVHDMENVDVTYMVSSDEILAKMELTINNTNWKEKYSICSPEMRRIKDKNLAVYHIINKNEVETLTEYIPGYAIMEENSLPQIISKRIYFDTSYVNAKDALRTIRRKYPTVVIGNSKFDIDDDWVPYEVFEYREKIFTSNGNDYGLIILNLMDGTSEKYPIAEGKVPKWVDFTTTYPR